MIKKNKNIFLDSSGIAAVEFAFIAPILITLFIGVVDLGLYMNDKMKLDIIPPSPPVLYHFITIYHGELYILFDGAV